MSLALEINRSRFLRTIEEMALIGLLPDEAGGGRDRRPFSTADRQARAYFQREAAAAGLAVRVDGAANLSARLSSPAPDARTLLIGSHLDTVPHGGAFDGALGVLAGLETLRTLKENNVALRHHVEVIDFTDEEGRFGDFFGSRALTGALTDDKLETFLAAAGEYADDLAAAGAEICDGAEGLTPASVRKAQRDPKTLAGYLEIHIEQGPRLQQAAVAIGVVSAIFGRRSWTITFRGRSDHAGTTPMGMRRDALVAAARYIAGAPQRVAEQVPEAVVTCGRVDVQPGVFNVVPGAATVWTEFRAASEAELDRVEALLLALAAEACGEAIEHSVAPAGRSHPTPMDADMQETIRTAAQQCELGSLDLPSGAGHDAQMLATVTPTGMIFVPSLDGRSHSPDEFTEPDDLVAGAAVLLRATLALAAR